MERESEIAKLVNVLRRTARMAMQSAWTGAGQDSGAFCAEQYNRVLARLKEIDPDLAPVFEPLPAESSLTVAAMACRQLAAYYEDEAPSDRWGRGYGAAGFDPQAFKDFWRQGAKDIEDLGEFIRESVEEWSRQRRGHRDKGEEHKGPGCQ